MVTKNKAGAITEAAICAKARQSCAQPDTLMHAPAHENWQRLAAAVQRALEVFRTRTVYSYLVAKADYGAAALKYRVLTGVLYGHGHLSACQGQSSCTHSRFL